MQSLQIVILMVLVATQTLGLNLDGRENHPSLAKAGYNDKLKNFLDVTVRDFMRTGNQSLGIPIIDPFVQDEFEISLDEAIIKLEGLFNDIEAKEISSFIIDKAAITLVPPKLTIGLNFSNIYASGLYKFSGTAVDKIEVYGDGAFDTIVKDFVFKVVLKFSLSGGKISIRSADLDLSLGGLDLVATGLFNDDATSAIMSELISNMAPQMLFDFHDDITDFMSSQIQDIGNAFLKEMSLKDLLAILG